MPLSENQKSKRSIDPKVDKNQRGFSVLELITGIGLLAIVVLAIILQLNPLERANSKRDERLRHDARILSGAIKSFSEHENRLPWADDFGTPETRPALAWTAAKEPQVGVCKESSCLAGGDLVEKSKLDLAFSQGGSVNATPEDTLYVGKGKAPGDKVFVCFLPNSELERENFDELYSVDLDVPITSRGTPLTCSDKVSWKETDICYICL